VGRAGRKGLPLRGAAPTALPWPWPRPGSVPAKVRLNQECKCSDAYIMQMSGLRIGTALSTDPFRVHTRGFSTRAIETMIRT
jgi:hypothetical protein